MLSKESTILYSSVASVFPIDVKSQLTLELLLKLEYAEPSTVIVKVLASVPIYLPVVSILLCAVT